MQPLTFTTPKPLIKVNGERMIDSVIKALHKNSITEIYVVVGHLKEEFDVLTKDFEGITLIENPYYNTCNNISSFENMIKLALDKLYNDDSYLFNIDTSSKIKKHVGERAIVFRFGLYFQQELDKYEFFNDFKLDCEYNRSGSNPKQLQIILDYA